MYNEYFGFKEAPFSIAPDPRYLYMTSQHRDALAHLVYGFNSDGGCILLTGEVGTGKTTICRCLLEQIPTQANVALVLNPKVNETELLETICDELNISYPDSGNSLKTYTDKIHTYLIESNRKNEKTVLIIDEAQNLDNKVLEQLRLLTNLETNQRKLLQIIILGQPELLDILAASEMRQLAQRITARFHLQPLTKSEVKAYVSHRLAVAGQSSQLFSEGCTKLLYKLSKGVPRLINILCDRALLGTYVENQYAVSTVILKKAAKEVFGELQNVQQHNKNKRWLYPLAILSSITIIAVVTFNLFTLPTYTPDVQYKQATIVPETPADIINEKPQEPPQKKAKNKQRYTAKMLIDDIDSLNYLDQPQETETAEAPAQTTSLSNDIKTTDINTVLNDSNNTSISAYKELFKIWGKVYDPTIKLTACKQARMYSLNCLYKHGNINSLKIHNRPAVLTLINSEGRTLYITVAAINDDLATIYSSHIQYQVKLEELDKYWFGQYILLWNKPEQYSSVITPGDQGETINWLNTQLTKINNLDSLGIVNTYDGQLLKRVKTFQSKQGLAADGVVGPVTILHLNTFTDSGAPILFSETLSTTIN